MTPEQCKSGRAALDWSILDLAAKAAVAPNTVLYLENGKGVTRSDSRRKIREALEGGGIVFIETMDGYGVVKKR